MKVTREKRFKRTMIVSFGTLILLVLIVFHCHSVDGSGNRKQNVCPAWAQIEAFFQVEILLLSSANWCNERQQFQVSQILTDLMYETFEDVPNLISASAALCPLPNQKDDDARRNLQLDSAGDNREESYGTAMAFLENKISGMKSGNTMTSVPSELRNEINSTISQTDIVKRFLRSMFIYQGGMRCRFCYRDNADLRRVLGSETDIGNHGEMRSSMTTPEKNKATESVNLRKLFFWSDRRKKRRRCRQKWKKLEPALRPRQKRSGHIKSWKVTASVSTREQVSNLRVTFRIKPGGSDGSSVWNTKNYLRVTIGSEGETFATLPLAPKGNETHFKFRNRYSGKSGLVLYRSNGDVRVVLGLNLFKMFSLFGSFSRTTSLTFQVLRSSFFSRTKSFELQNFKVRGAEICSRGITGSRNTLKKWSSRQWSVEEDFEWRLSWHLTNRFRENVENDESNCFYDTDPTIYVNLFEKDNFAEAQPTCPVDLDDIDS